MIQDGYNLSVEEAVRMALTQVEGAYAIVVLDKENPNKLVAARKGSPLAIGVSEDGFYLASDAMPMVEYTREIIFMNDDEVATVDFEGNISIKNLDDENVSFEIAKVDMEIEMLEKGEYDFYMLKEIYEQSKTIKKCMAGRLDSMNNQIKMSGLDENWERFEKASRIIITSCGTSWHAGLIGEYLFEELARIPVEVEYASEFRYRNPIITENDIVIALSQSGETADTLAALELAKKNKALTYGIVNAVGSSISRLTDVGSYIHAGSEIGVASTKAFTGQVTVLTMMALEIARRKGTITQEYFNKLVRELDRIPQKIEKILESEARIQGISEIMQSSEHALYLGRGYNFPIALEGALKLKEISYIHAEGYPAAEMKHGPIALIDENMPVVVIATNQSAYEKIVSNIQEVKARKGKVIAIVNEGDETIKNIADVSIDVPITEEPLTPLLSVIPLQLLSYHIAVMRGCDVDQPRNLAKSVTVE